MRRTLGTKGSALIEAALVLPVFGFLVISSVDITRSLDAQQVAVAAARAGVHRALQTPGDPQAAEAAAIADGGAWRTSAHATRECSCSAMPQPSSCEALRCTGAPAAWVHVETRVAVETLLRVPGAGSKYYATAEAWMRVE